MDKGHLLYHQFTVALEASKNCLNDTKLFPGQINVTEFSKEVELVREEDESTSDEEYAELEA